MIAYTTLGTNDFNRAAEFYDALLGETGAKRLLETDRLIFWGTSMSVPMLAIAKPYDGKAASAGNGTMISLGVGSKAEVDALYARRWNSAAATKAHRGRAVRAARFTSAISAIPITTS